MPAGFFTAFHSVQNDKLVCCDKLGLLPKLSFCPAVRRHEVGKAEESRRKPHFSDTFPHKKTTLTVFYPVSVISAFLLPEFWYNSSFFISRARPSRNRSRCRSRSRLRRPSFIGIFSVFSFSLLPVIPLFPVRKCLLFCKSCSWQVISYCDNINREK